MVFDNKMWVLGGRCSEWGAARNDIWTSTDGSTWTQVTSAAAWPPRFSHNAVIFKNKIWILGGGKSDVWYSSDGKNWTCATSNAAYPARSESQTVVYDNKLWIVGGISGSTCYNDLWYSENGAAWTKATPAATWKPKGNHQAVVYDKKIWILGGKDDWLKHYNDIWYYELPNVGVETGGKQPPPPATGVTVDAMRSAASGGPVTIRYTLNKTGSVGIGIYTCTGREIRMLWNGVQCAGTHTVAWDGCDAGGRKIGAGAHFVRLRSGNEEVTRKIVVGGP